MIVELPPRKGNKASALGDASHRSRPNLAMRPLPTPLLLLSLSIRLGSGASSWSPPDLVPYEPPAPAQVQELPVSSTIPKYTTTNTTTIVVDDESALAEAATRRRQLRARRIKTEVAASASNDNANQYMNVNWQ